MPKISVFLGFYDDQVSWEKNKFLPKKITRFYSRFQHIVGYLTPKTIGSYSRPFFYTSHVLFYVAM
jgi:hypothetical protein